MPFKIKPVAKAEPDPILVTMAFTVSIKNPEAMVAATRCVLGARGMLDEDVIARINDGDGFADLGKCIRALMEESVAALAGATGADVGEIETYAEMPPVPQGGPYVQHIACNGLQPKYG